FHDRADLDGTVTAGGAELLEGNAALGLQTDVDDREILLDRDDGSLDDGALHRLVVEERVHQHGLEVFLGHRFNCQALISIVPPVAGVRARLPSSTNDDPVRWRASLTDVRLN